MHLRIEEALAAPSLVSEVRLKLTELFAANGVPEAAESAKLLVCAAADCRPISLITEPDSALSDAAVLNLREMVRRRLLREPVSRIIGRKNFWGHELVIGPACLDPRPDTECLIETCLAWLGKRTDQSLRILDVGVGSGAILCALLSELPEAQGVGIDVSSEACLLARANLDRVGVGQRATVHCADMRDFDAGPFDLVVSNPPYIPSDQISLLDDEVRLYDPRLALDGGPDGLDLYRSLIAIHGGWLKNGGLCAVEIGYDQASGLLELLARSGVVGTVRKDLLGHDRVVFWGADKS